MENYNLTAELKKIASGITTSDPNTNLDNINNGVGNLDTAMQGVATAINGISIPNPGSNIDGVATAIGNISIPNPSTNIDGVATAVDNLAGGKDLGDIETILTTMNGNIANLGSNHVVGIEVAPAGATGYMVWYGNGRGTPLTNLAEKTHYTDTNNIGATNVQSAVDKLSGMGRYYDQAITNISTSGGWGQYTSNTVQFNLPSTVYGSNKMYMLLLSTRIQGLISSNFESYIEVVNGRNLLIPRHYARITNEVWHTVNHISFFTCDTDPIIRVNVATSVPTTKLMWVQCILVPLG